MPRHDDDGRRHEHGILVGSRRGFHHHRWMSAADRTRGVQKSLGVTMEYVKASSLRGPTRKEGPDEAWQFYTMRLFRANIAGGTALGVRHFEKSWKGAEWADGSHCHILILGLQCRGYAALCEAKGHAH